MLLWHKRIAKTSGTGHGPSRLSVVFMARAQHSSMNIHGEWFCQSGRIPVEVSLMPYFDIYPNVSYSLFSFKKRIRHG